MLVIKESLCSEFKENVKVVACYLEYKGKILLLHRSPHQKCGDLWGVPAGKVEEGESLLLALKREVWEETGIVLSEKVQTLGTLYIQKPDCSYSFHMYCVELEKCPEVQLNDEHVDYRWVTVDEARTLPLILAGEEALDYYQRQRIKAL